MSSHTETPCTHIYARRKNWLHFPKGSDHRPSRPAAVTIDLSHRFARGILKMSISREEGGGIGTRNGRFGHSYKRAHFSIVIIMPTKGIVTPHAIASGLLCPLISPTAWYRCGIYPFVKRACYVKHLIVLQLHFFSDHLINNTDVIPLL